MVCVDRTIQVDRIIHVTRTNRPAEPATREQIGKIFAEFMGAMREFRCAAGIRLVRAGVSMTHLHLMWILEQHGDLPMSRLAEILDVSVSSATGIVDRMEERGLVDRVRVPDDRRVVLVRISDRGREVLRQMDVLKEDLMAEIVRRLDGPRQERLAGAMADVRDQALAILAEGGLTLGQRHDHRHPHPRSEPEPAAVVPRTH
jgi:DNA-binding MarR family transcriptional regulator